MTPTDYFGDSNMHSWTLAEIYADLGSKQDISKTLNVNPHRANQWILRRSEIHSPFPVRRISHIDIYSMQEWKDWFARWEERHKDRQWWEKTLPHGSGESFWSYFDHE